MSDKAKPGFTEGKWEREGRNIVVRGRGAIVMILVPQLGGTFDCEANARLIAQAPAMYEALHTIVDCWDIECSTDKFVHHLRDNGFIDEARAVIAAVKGEK